MKHQFNPNNLTQNQIVDKLTDLFSNSILGSQVAYHIINDSDKSINELIELGFKDDFAKQLHDYKINQFEKEALNNTVNNIHLTDEYNQLSESNDNGIYDYRLKILDMKLKLSNIALNSRTGESLLKTTNDFQQINPIPSAPYILIEKDNTSFELINEREKQYNLVLISNTDDNNLNLLTAKLDTSLEIIDSDLNSKTITLSEIRNPYVDLNKLLDSDALDHDTIKELVYILHENNIVDIEHITSTYLHKTIKDYQQDEKYNDNKSSLDSQISKIDKLYAIYNSTIQPKEAEIQSSLIDNILTINNATIKNGYYEELSNTPDSNDPPLINKGHYVNGKKEGEWNSYEDGTLWLSENYKDGILNGNRTFYHEDGNIDYKEEYKEGNKINQTNKNGLKQGKWEDIGINGFVAIGQYNNGNKEGEWEIYSNNNKFIKLETYENGILNGRSKICYDNGITEEGNYKNGLKDGEFEYCDSNRNKESIKIFLKGKEINLKNDEGIKHGIWKEHKGDVQLTVNYIDGLKQGKATHINYTSQIEAEGLYKNNKMEGEWKFDYPQMDQCFTNYKDGVEHGDYKELKFNQDKNQMVLFRKGQHIDGKMEGEWITYDKNEIPKYSYTYKLDKKTGEFKSFYDTSQIKITANLIDGRYEGKYITFRKNGDIKETTNYLNGVKDGLSVSFDNENKAVCSTYYLKGQEISEKDYLSKAEPDLIYLIESNDFDSLKATPQITDSQITDILKTDKLSKEQKVIGLTFLKVDNAFKLVKKLSKRVSTNKTKTKENNNTLKR